MNWTVAPLNETVKAEIAALPASLRGRLFAIIDRIKAVGLENVGEPHVKHIEGKIWEMRAKGSDGIARALYITATGRKVVILHAFVKKGDKTPETAKAIARKRAKEVK
jgi:phage-related protein